MRFARFLYGCATAEPQPCGKYPHTPLHSVFGAAQWQEVGNAAGEGVYPSLQLKSQGLPAVQMGCACVGYVQVLCPDAPFIWSGNETSVRWYTGLSGGVTYEVL